MCFFSLSSLIIKDLSISKFSTLSTHARTRPVSQVLVMIRGREGLLSWSPGASEAEREATGYRHNRLQHSVSKQQFLQRVTETKLRAVWLRFLRIYTEVTVIMAARWRPVGGAGGVSGSSEDSDLEDEWVERWVMNFCN